jgi:hypothetical protein
MYFISKVLTLCALIILASFLLNPTNAQVPTIEWQNTIGGNQWEILMSVEQTNDGGYILGGYSQSGISGDKTEANLGGSDYWIVKLDGLGNIVWQNTIGGNSIEYLYSVQQTSDGGYVLGGQSNSDVSGDKTEANLGEYDYWIVKLDGFGNIVWQNTIGGNLDEELRSIQQTKDNGYILGGSSNSNISSDKTEANLGGYDCWIVKLDGLGNIVWQNTIGGNLDDGVWPVQQTSDSGYILGGFSQSSISSDKTEASLGGFDWWVLKLDGSGNIVWQNTIGGGDDEYLVSIQQTSDKGYILGGGSGSGISGDKTEPNLGEADYWVVKLNGLGNIVWQNTIGGYLDDGLWSLQQTSDGGYILGGSSESGISGDKTEANLGSRDYWIVKLTPDPSISVEDMPFPVIPDQLTVFPAFPNPFNPSTTISYGIENDSRVIIQIYDLSGRIISTLQDNDQTQGWHSVVWNGTNQQGEQAPAGVYFSRITSGSEVKTSKLMLLK